MANGTGDEQQTELVPPEPKEINKAVIQFLEKKGSAKLPSNPDLKGMNYLLTGIIYESDDPDKGKITLQEADVGDYLGAYNHGPMIVLEGRARNYLGLGLSKGDIFVTRDVEDRTGCYQSGGVIVIRGNCGKEAGLGMMGGTLFIEGSAKDLTGHLMTGGEIIVVGDCGKDTGLGMTGGIIFVRGEIDRIGEGVRSKTITSKDKSRLQGIFKDFGIDYEAREFVKVVPEVKK